MALFFACMSVISRSSLVKRRRVGAKTTARLRAFIRFSSLRAATLLWHQQLYSRKSEYERREGKDQPS